MRRFFAANKSLDTCDYDAPKYAYGPFSGHRAGEEYCETEYTKAMRYDQHRAFAANPSERDLCHCGRLKRYGNCCKGMQPAEIDQRIHGLSLQERTNLTVDAVRYFLFGGKATDLNERRYFTTERVAEFYRYLSDLWPHRLRAIDSIRALRDEATLSGYYVGDPRPETILRNISRLALYTDRIFIRFPFYLPWAIRDRFDPVQHPEKMLQDTRRWAILVLLLAAGIRSGIILFVPNPASYDQTLRDKFLAAGKRREAEGRITIPPDDFAAFEEKLKSDYLRQLFSLPDNEIVARIKKAVGLDEAAVPSLLAHIHAQRESDPLYVPGAAEGNPLMMVQIPTVDETVLACGLANAFPFTDQSGRWAELRDELALLPPDAETWSPLSKAFADCPLEFLNVEDTDLAFRIREDGRLRSFRDFMRQVWRDIDGTADPTGFDAAARSLADRLHHEHEVATAEWKTIKARFKSAVRQNTILGAFGGIAAAPTIGGAFSLGLSFVTLLLLSANDARRLRVDQNEFRARIPMSIFVELRKSS
jgi:hypothetical protein